MKPLVIYHADCTDGFAAAFAARLKLGDEAEYEPMQYGKLLPLDDFKHFIGNRPVYMLDFSLPREYMDAMFENAERVVWLDHHKTAFEMWCGKYSQGYVYTREGDSHIVLNDNKSGALLAWEYFHPGTEVPMIVRHIDDRDRWQFNLDGSKELHAALASYKPWSFEQWDTLFQTYAFAPGHFMTAGKALLRTQNVHVAGMAKQARKCAFRWDDAAPGDISFNETILPGLAVNATLHISEVGHELANQSGTYGLVWYVGGDNRVKCSLRSNGEYDVSAIARSFGGGGHRNAAGFETDVETLMGWLS